jgi:hypothetical protein
MISAGNLRKDSVDCELGRDGHDLIVRRSSEMIRNGKWFVWLGMGIERVDSF